jgi:hypothetical protein
VKSKKRIESSLPKWRVGCMAGTSAKMKMPHDYTENLCIIPVGYLIVILKTQGENIVEQYGNGWQTF